MLKPSEYVAAALRGLRSSALAGNAAELTCGDAFATVTRVAPVEIGEDNLQSEEPAEEVRVLALAADFPDIRKGCAAELDGNLRLVTSAKVDAAGATLTVGLTAPFARRRATYSRPGSNVVQPLDVLATEGNVLDQPGDAFAPTLRRSWLVAFDAGSWIEVSDPQVGDEVTLDEARLRVASVAKRDGYWLLTCRARRAS